MAVMNVRGVRLNYRVIGDRGPWFALTTGGRRAHGEFIPLANKIADYGFRVVLHDRRNTGASEIMIEGTDSEEEIWADDLHILLGELGALPAFIGGASSGARMSILYALRHEQTVRGLVLFRVTGGAFAAGRLPEQYYGQFIRTAREGGMAAVCAMAEYSEQIAAIPANRKRLMNMDPKHYIEVMQRWCDQFTAGKDLPVMGVSEADLKSIELPAIVIPGNDKIHSSTSGKIAHQFIAGSELHQLPIEDEDVDLIPFEDWAPYQDEIARTFADFMMRVAQSPATR